MHSSYIFIFISKAYLHLILLSFHPAAKIRNAMKCLPSCFTFGNFVQMIDFGQEELLLHSTD